MPEFDAALRNPDNEKVTIKANAPAFSFANVDNIEQLEALKGRSVEDAEGNLVQIDSRRAPIEGQLAALATMNPGSRPSIALLASGDIVYHKVYKEEAKVRYVGTDGRVRIKFKNGDKIWAKADSIVKL